MLTCSAITAPAHPAGQCCLAFTKPKKPQNQLQGFCKEPCEGSTCWPVCSRVPEHGRPQKGDLGGSATAQEQHSKSSHAVESVRNPGTPTLSDIPPCPGEHSFPWDHARGPTASAVHPVPPGDVPRRCGELPVRRCAEQCLLVHACVDTRSWPCPLARCVRAPTSFGCSRREAASSSDKPVLAQVSGAPPVARLLLPSAGF